MPDTPQEISLLESLNGEWLKLPLAIMQDVGPAAQTMGALLKITKRETFVPVGDIALKARVPLATARKHLDTLHERGWIINEGRQKTRSGYPRRTATIKISAKTKAQIEPYGFLPWWACCSVAYKPQGRVKRGRSKALRAGQYAGRLPWCCKAVLAVWFSRLLSLASAIEQDGEGYCIGDEISARTEMQVADGDGDPDSAAHWAAVRREVVSEVTAEVAGDIDNLGGADRFRFSLDWLVRQTGLDHKSVVSAKRILNHHYGILRWRGDRPVKGHDTPTDLLLPNFGFRVVITPAGPGTIYVTFKGDGKNGQ